MYSVRSMFARLRPVLLAVAMLTIAPACAGELDIVHGLDEFEANEIMVILEGRGISSHKTKEEGRIVTYAVVVSGDDSEEALRILVANRLPRPRPRGLAQVYPADSGGLIPTRTEEKAKYLMALQGEVERKLMTFPGIVYAYVSVVVPDKDIVRNLDTPPPPATASVSLVYNPIDAKGLASLTDVEVKALVANSVEDLKPDFVQVVMKRNIPSVLIDPDVNENGEAQARGETVLGIRVMNQGSGTRVKVIFGLFASLAVVGLGLGGGGLWRALSLQKRLTTAENELKAYKGARGGGGTSTGIPPAV